MKSKVTSLAPGDYSHKQSEQLRLREFVWAEITSPPPLPTALASGPSTRASRGPWGCRCRGTRGPARSRPWPCRSPPRRGRLGPRARSGPGCPPACTPPRATAPRTRASGSGCARRVSGIGAEHRAQPLLGQVAAPQRRHCPREPASAVATRVASGVARAPQPPWCAGSAPRWPTSPLVGKTGSARVTPPLGWRFHRDVNPQTPEELSLMYFSHCW